jgi:hypothetical protein
MDILPSGRHIPTLLLGLYIGEAGLVVVKTITPSNCDQCEKQSHFAPVRHNFPGPELRPVISAQRSDGISDAAAAGGSGGVSVTPGTGELILEGFAPSVVTSDAVSA